jgi:hypothetical protein
MDEQRLKYELLYKCTCSHKSREASALAGPGVIYNDFFVEESL